MTTKPRAKFYEWADGSAAYATQRTAFKNEFEIEFEFPNNSLVKGWEKQKSVLWMTYNEESIPFLKVKTGSEFFDENKKKAWGMLEDIDFPVMVALVLYAESGGPLSELSGPGWRWQIIDSTLGPTTTGEARAAESIPRHVVWNPRTGAEGQGSTLAEAVRAIPTERRSAEK